MSSASIHVTGNVTSDPELKYGANGQARLAFSIASSSSWKDNDGEWQEETSFFNVVAWRGIAEAAAQILEKGLAVIVIGKLNQRSWETPEGDKRSTVEIKADHVGPNNIGITGITRRQKGERVADGVTASMSAGSNAPAAVSPNAGNMEEEPF